MKERILSLTVAVLLGMTASMTVAQEQIVDRVVAVVGDQIILLSEVKRQLEAQMMERNLNRNTSPDVLASLQNEVIESMVNEQLLQVKAKRDSIIPDPRDIDSFAKTEYARIRKQFPDDDAFTKALSDAGLSEPQLRYMYFTLARKNVIQQMVLREIEQNVSVSPQDLEAWYAANRDSLKDVPEQFRFSHIMIVPKIAEAKKGVARKKLRDIQEKLKGGADFAELANAYSEIPGGTKDGGYVSWFKRGDFDERFTNAAFSLKKGEVSDIVETQLGLHLIKVDDIRGTDEISARHIVILLKAGPEEETETVRFLNAVRDSILTGALKFEDTAKRYSDDVSTRDQGGQAKWLSKGDEGFPASFAEQASIMKPGEISRPFKSEFNAYHIVRLDDHRAEHIPNLKDDRGVLESSVRQRKIISEFERLFSELRKETFIDIRYD